MYSERGTCVKKRERKLVSDHATTVFGLKGDVDLDLERAFLGDVFGVYNGRASERRCRRVGDLLAGELEKESGSRWFAPMSEFGREQRRRGTPAYALPQLLLVTNHPSLSM
ncbi:hypothetical protein D6783_03550 [Candidatus Woesearchaeota archaeon]|nr:MAG: hypothetical protein D6783_03550 [Candidatus Woesearchaeota archaeon]